MIVPGLSNEILFFSILVGLLFAAIICLIGYILGLLDISGVVAGSFVGGIIYGFYSLEGSVLIVAFFLSSNLLSIIKSWIQKNDREIRPRRNWKRFRMPSGQV